MKQKLAWLTVPLVLCALVWGVKWRAEHPSPTKLDLRMRELISESTIVNFSYSPPRNSKNLKEYHSMFLKSQGEFSPFIESLYLIPEPHFLGFKSGAGGHFTFLWSMPRQRKDRVDGGFIQINISERKGISTSPYPNENAHYDLYPATVKRWIELLLNDPRIGPELRACMNS